MGVCELLDCRNSQPRSPLRVRRRHARRGLVATISFSTLTMVATVGKRNRARPCTSWVSRGNDVQDSQYWPGGSNKKCVALNPRLRSPHANAGRLRKSKPEQRLALHTPVLMSNTSRSTTKYESREPDKCLTTQTPHYRCTTQTGVLSDLRRAAGVGDQPCRVRNDGDDHGDHPELGAVVGISGSVCFGVPVAAHKC